MEPKATAIAALKQEMRIQEWTSQIEAQQSSGKTVKQWCAGNGIKPNTYYNRLQKVCSRIIDSAPSIVSLHVSYPLNNHAPVKVGSNMLK